MNPEVKFCFFSGCLFHGYYFCRLASQPVFLKDQPGIVYKMPYGILGKDNPYMVYIFPIKKITTRYQSTISDDECQCNIGDLKNMTTFNTPLIVCLKKNVLNDFDSKMIWEIEEK